MRSFSPSKTSRSGQHRIFHLNSILLSPFLGAGVGHLSRASLLDTATETTLHSGWPTGALSRVPAPTFIAYSPQKKPVRSVHLGPGLAIPCPAFSERRSRSSSSSCLAAPSSGKGLLITSEFSTLHLLSESRNEPFVAVRVSQTRSSVQL